MRSAFVRSQAARPNPRRRGSCRLLPDMPEETWPERLDATQFPLVRVAKEIDPGNRCAVVIVPSTNALINRM